ncbi:bifunctional SDR family oxidoreductase/pyridoxal phosphate-dependent aminotransferase family protein [Streptomyces sp. PT12]|uniref:bifunctional SDR family oxidoreductase/pyridoxal phosphate-dependent aminotransferase family protein n=1 Tax=Streptomyces sp. PT12 TaxID=1510197 RepID=UPI000DE55F1F|nr:bifunctional SDR family oxidoreductase/pyridoxal phosphate-dependent aminotransferase family protein [Streptomyces sp. PT12]RBM11808.1 aminotransferase [Streptomyces sp. PT12]
MSGLRIPLSAADPLVDDHRIGATPVIAAALQIDAMLRACDARRPDSVWTLRHVAFREPLRVTGEGIDLDVVTAPDGRCSVRSDGTEYSTAHARGVPLPPPRYLDVAELRGGCTQGVPLAGLAEWRRASGITYGPAFRSVHSLHRAPGRMLAVLRAADDDAHPAAFVPPPLLDGVFQVLAMLDAGATGACLPWYIGRLVARRRITGTILALVERDPAPGTGAAVRGRATVCNQQGEVLLELDRVTLKATAPAPSAPGAAAGLIETVTWRTTSPAAAPPATEGALLLVAPRDLAPPRGRPVVRVAPDELSPERLDETLVGDPVREVVHVAPEGAVHGNGVTPALQGVFALVRRLAARPPMPDLLIVTSAAHDVTGGERVDPFMTALWGLGRTLRAEYPRTTVRLVDLEPGSGPPPWDALPAGPELARRGDRWYEPAPEPHRPSSAKPPRWRGGRFLITGGMGAIGLRVAEFLAERGCAHLTLVGRNVPEAGEARQRLERLGRLCALDIVAADVRALPDVLGGEGRYDGIFHTAGVLRDGLARGLTQRQVGEVLGPKVDGVHALAELAAGHAPPDLVVLFSSVAATRANLGQSSYAAANAYLDGYAARRRAAGEPWYSLGWGLWTVGMGRDVAPRASAHGIPALTADDGVALLEAALGCPPANYLLSATEQAKGEPMTAVIPESGLWPQLTTAVRKIFYVDEVTPDDDLLEMGLDSMMAVELAASLTGCQLDVDPLVFFEHSRVGALLGHLETLPRVGTPSGPADAAPPERPGTASAEAPATPVSLPVREPSAPAPAPAPVPAPARADTDTFTPDTFTPDTFTPDTFAPDTFTPDWDRYRSPEPAPPPRSPARARAVPEAPAPPPSAAGRLPRRTLPGRLVNAAGGTFLDRRLDALSEEDRLIVARDEYFYEPVIEQADGARIRFDGRWFLNFASYSYLGLIGHDYIDQRALDAVERHGTGAHGVRLLAGTLHLHRELELALARFLGTEDAIVYSSGYMANVATVGALVGPGDVIVGDVYNHASILDGYRLSGAKVITYAHNDLADLERALKKTGQAGRLVVTDAVFSMDGDVADLPGLVELCERYDAPLMVDEAHSLGVLGDTGRGITEHFGIDPARVDVKMGTLSKTVPSAGGYVAGSRDLVFALKNNARGWMFSAAVTPAQAAAARAAIEVMTAAPERTRELRAKTTRYRERLRALGFNTLASETPVVPVVCRSAEEAGAMARLCQHDGLFVQPIVYPAVPRTLPRLRTIVNLSHTEADLETAVTTLEKAGRACGLIP